MLESLALSSSFLASGDPADATQGSALVRVEGLYIALLTLACLVGIAVKYLIHLPYTIALTLFGLGLALSGVAPPIESTGFSKELIFFVVLPPLLFQAALHLEIDRLLDHLWPIAAFASVGVLIATFGIGAPMYWWGGIDSWLVALLFGAMLAPTDPVSVLALFREVRVPSALKYLVEGESLFNDGTGVVVFGILLNLILQGADGDFSLGAGLLTFVKVAAGGALVGGVVGWLTFELLRRLDDHLLENALCLVLALGSFWLAESIHVSGVIATVIAGLFIGNNGRRFAMSAKTTETVETFFASIDFLINSLLFILIGLELQVVTREQLMGNLVPLGVAIAALLVSRAVAVYPLYYLTNGLGAERHPRWAHVLFWGGLRGSLPIALLLGLPSHPTIDPYRPLLLVACFGSVFFSLVVQGITMKPLLVRMNLGDDDEAPAEAAAH